MVIVLQILGLRWEIIWPLTCKNFSRKLAFNPVQNYYDHCKQKTLKKIAKSFFCELLLQLPAKHFLYKTFEGNCTHFGCILNLESLRKSMNACLLWIFNVKVWKSESAFSRLFQVVARNLVKYVLITISLGWTISRKLCENYCFQCTEKMFQPLIPRKDRIRKYSE